MQYDFLPEKTYISYAQNREDFILMSFFPDVRNGFYIDIGANDPTTHSVTKIFYEAGWCGINIDPIQMMIKKMKIDRPRDINLQVAIAGTRGKKLFHEYIDGHGVSTMSKIEMQSNDKIFKYKEYEVDTIKLIDIYEYCKDKVVNFLKIDVEGFEYEVLASNDWIKFRPEVICIEANHINKDWKPLLVDAMYDRVFNDGLNDYYVDSKTDRASKFDYVGMLLRNPSILFYDSSNILSYIKEKFDEKEINIKEKNKIISAEVDKNAHLSAENNALTAQISNLTTKLHNTIEHRTKRKISKILGKI
jgi:FkbM family methyltransferase